MKDPLSDKSRLRTTEYQKSFSYKNLYRSTGAFVSPSRAVIGKPMRKRKNVKDLEPKEQELLKTAFEKAVKSGEHMKLMTFHSQYMFDIHSFPRANQRFLPWHRVYLIKFEEMLNNVVKQEANNNSSIALPYWNWATERDIPELFHDPIFRPTFDIDVYLWREVGLPPVLTTFNDFKVKRFLGTDPDVPELPTKEEVDQIKSETEFARFSLGLESGPHNRVHMWVGGENPNPDPNNPFDYTGAMGDAHVSPCDPIFYLHHANIDRIWAGWQKELEDQGTLSHIYPDLDEEKSKMHPWWPDYAEPQTRQIEEMGYSYDNYK
jgi:tyrosinase